MSPANESGYSGTPLVKKLGLKPGARLRLVAAPADFADTLGPLPEGVVSVGPNAAGVDLTLVFAERASKLAPAFTRLARRMDTNGSLWAAWPKQSSGVPTDLSFDAVQRIGLAAGLVDVKICAIDATWSGLKFVLRVADRTPGHRPGARRKARPKRKA